MINYGVQAKENRQVDALPAGAYIGRIVGAELKTVDTSSGGQFERLELRLDVTEGEYKDHYSNQFVAQQGGQFPAKYKGTIRYNIPQKDSQFEASQKRALEHLAFCLEDSNKNYKWNGDETKLVGLAIGFSVRERDWLMERDGVISHGTTTEIGRVESIKRIKAGEVKPMKKRELSDADKQKLEEYQKTVNGAMVEVDDEDVPF